MDLSNRRTPRRLTSNILHSIRNRPDPFAPGSPIDDNRWLFTTFVFASHVGSPKLALEAVRGLLHGIDSFLPSRSRDLMSESRGAPARAREGAILRLVSEAWLALYKRDTHN